MARCRCCQKRSSSSSSSSSESSSSSSESSSSSSDDSTSESSSSSSENGVSTCCCPNPVPVDLFAEITGCSGGIYGLTGVAGSQGAGVWNSGGGEICPEIGPAGILIDFRCDGELGPDPCTFVVLIQDAAFGPFSGTLVSCDPFIWVSDPINLDAFGCTCGDFTITVTE